jgi:hypothetical protein
MVGGVGGEPELMLYKAGRKGTFFIPMDDPAADELLKHFKDGELKVYLDLAVDHDIGQIEYYAKVPEHDKRARF